MTPPPPAMPAPPAAAGPSPASEPSPRTTSADRAASANDVALRTRPIRSPRDSSSAESATAKSRSFSPRGGLRRERCRRSPASSEQGDGLTSRFDRRFAGGVGRPSCLPLTPWSDARALKGPAAPSALLPDNWNVVICGKMSHLATLQARGPRANSSHLPSLKSDKVPHPAQTARAPLRHAGRALRPGRKQAGIPVLSSLNF